MLNCKIDKVFSLSFSKHFSTAKNSGKLLKEANEALFIRRGN